MMKKFIYLPVVVLLLQVSCSPKKIASDMTAKIMASGAPKMEQEYDVEIAQSASLTLLKMLETFQYDNPTNPIINTLLARSYANYTQGFLELELLKAKDAGDAARYQKTYERAKTFYERGRDYGLEALKRKGSFKSALTKDVQTFEKVVNGLGDSSVSELVWTVLAWGGWINLNKDSPQAIADFARVEMMMKRVLELDETYYFGTPHIFFGYSYGSRPKMFGGDLEKSREHFEIAVDITARKFLMALVYYAEVYAVQAQDQGLFETLLHEVLSTDAAALPEARLANEIAKLRARELLVNEKKYFGKVNKV